MSFHEGSWITSLHGTQIRFRRVDRIGDLVVWADGLGHPLYNEHITWIRGRHKYTSLRVQAMRAAAALQT